MIANDQFAGRTSAGWEPRHRLVKVEPGNPSTGALRVSNAYPVIPPAGRETGLRDYPPPPGFAGLRRTGMGRRVLKVVEEYGGGSWSTNSVTKFVYDQWNLALELDGLDDPVIPPGGGKRGLAADDPIARYTWGLDLSRTIKGAGGILLRPSWRDYGGQVGGLLTMTTASGGSCFYAYDGNPASGAGIVRLIDASGPSTPAATYVYEPFGSGLVSTGPAAGENPFRFSTKHLDAESGLLYFGYRYLSPELGRWLSRDPIDEEGGVNLYAIAENGVVDTIDGLGLAKITVFYIGDSLTHAKRGSRTKQGDKYSGFKTYLHEKMLLAKPTRHTLRIESVGRAGARVHEVLPEIERIDLERDLVPGCDKIIVLYLLGINSLNDWTAGSTQVFAGYLAEKPASVFSEWAKGRQIIYDKLAVREIDTLFIAMTIPHVSDDWHRPRTGPPVAAVRSRMLTSAFNEMIEAEYGSGTWWTYIKQDMSSVPEHVNDGIHFGEVGNNHIAGILFGLTESWLDW